MAIGTLELTLLGAKGLAKTDFFGKIEPYVVIEYGNQQRTSSIANGSKPLWNQKFNFTVDVAKHQKTVSLTLMDHDTFTQDDSLGQTTIYLQGAFERAMENENGKAELGAQKYRVVAKDGTFSGEIHVGITFTLKKESKEQGFGGWKESQFQDTHVIN